MASIGIECGATKSTIIVQISNKEIVLDGGPANYSLMVDSDLIIFLESIRDRVKLEIEKCGWRLEGQLPSIVKVALGMAGIVTESQIKAVGEIVSQVWSDLEEIWVGNDIQIAFSYMSAEYGNKKNYDGQLLVISGTGSVCFGRRGDKQVQIGGSGHVMGDRSSGYSISYKALQSAYRQFEHNGKSALLTAMMEYLNLETIPDLIKWSLKADKTSLASLARIVINYWTEYKDQVATKIIVEVIEDLSMDCQILIEKLYQIDSNESCVDKEQVKNILIGYTGSILTKCPHFAQILSETIKKRIDSNEKMKSLKIDIHLLDTQTVRGSLNFLSSQVDNVTKMTVGQLHFEKQQNIEANLRQIVLPKLTALPLTEERNPNSMNLDQMSTLDAIKLMLRQESGIYKAIETEIPKILILVEKITNAFKIGGRLFYVGAGTSGRLGILDASECPPTFKVPHHWVQGIIAGGPLAVTKSIEGAEDSAVGGMEAIKAKGIDEKDIVIGIAASGRTPFVWGALYQAKKANAYAGFITFNPNLQVNPEFPSLDILVTASVGPEVLTGSTRLKCGTATKSILNILTTLSMVRYGKCLENLMVDLNASNEKLRDRAARIVLMILGEEQPNLNKEEATRILQANEYNIKKTVELIRTTGKHS